MFEYTVCNQADTELFYKQCSALEKRFPGMIVNDILKDVNGSIIQQYTHDRGRIIVKNDTQVDALYVTSDFDLLPYFKQD